jgi:DUF1365 family protein
VSDRSAIYEGWISHRRGGPVEHAFRYRLFMPLLDLERLPARLDRHPLWSARRPAPVRFRRSDFLGGSDAPLADQARDLVAERTGSRPGGPVLLLANPRFLGVGFNPASFFFLYAGEHGPLEAVIVEVTNTPWGERTTYVLERGAAAGPGGVLRGRFQKRLHVSPFMPMEQGYELSVGEPGSDLRVEIRNLEGERIVFEASLELHRRELTPARSTRILLSYPPATAATLARIYWNALRLKLKGARYHRHPLRRRSRLTAPRPG